MQKIRKCLWCDKNFKSKGAWHRKCNKCRGKSETRMSIKFIRRPHAIKTTPDH